MTALITRNSVIDDLLVKKLQFETTTGLKWLRFHDTYIFKSLGTSIQNINPFGNFSALATRAWTAGTDVDKVEWHMFSNTTIYLGVATINKNLGNISDENEFIADIFTVNANDKIIMSVYTDYLEIAHNDTVKRLNLAPLNGQTVYPTIITVSNTLSASIISYNDLSIYTNEVGIPIFDTTKNLNKVQPVEFKTGGGEVVFDGNVKIIGTIIGTVAGGIDDSSASAITAYSSDKIDTLVSNIATIDDAKSSLTTTYSSDKTNTLIADAKTIDDVTSSTTTSYSSNKIDTLIANAGPPGASVLSVASGQSIVTSSTIQYTLTLAHVSLVGTVNTSLFSASTGNVVISNINTTNNPIITFDVQFDTADSAIALTYTNGVGANQMKNAVGIAFPSAIANNTVAVTV